MWYGHCTRRRHGFPPSTTNIQLLGARAVKRPTPFVAVVAGVLAFVWIGSGITRAATVPLTWQTTFNCSDWNQTMGLTAAQMNCDGMGGYGNWATSGHPSGDQITAAANNPAGGGGRGFRHWRGDGTNINGGGFSMNLPTALTEMWMRFYMRYQAGFQWSLLNYTKDVYFHDGTVLTLGFHSANSWGVSVISPSVNLYGNYGWQSVMGNSTSDGLWHCYESHLKAGPSGIAESWIDGVLVHSNTNVSFLSPLDGNTRKSVAIRQFPVTVLRCTRTTMTSPSAAPAESAALVAEP